MGESAIFFDPAGGGKAPADPLRSPPRSRTEIMSGGVGAARSWVGDLRPGCDETAPWRALADRLGVTFLARVIVDPAPAEAFLPDREAITRVDRLWLGAGEMPTLVAAPGEGALPALAAAIDRSPDLARRFAVSTPREIRRALIERHGIAIVDRAVRTVLDRDPVHSAVRTVSTGQMTVLVVIAVAWIAAVADLSRQLLALFTALFLGLGLFRAHVADALPEAAAASTLAEADLPRFAVLVPLHREADVVEDLVTALLRLDYPADRLMVRLVVEADDEETLAAAEAAVLGTPIEVIAVPPAAPRTKPKALDFALHCVDAPFVSIFDAEDRPDPDQLRRAAAAFHAGDRRLAVVQAALEIDHAETDRPWLVRQFEIEYAMLFHGLLPWLARRGLFLPLGGTSNHFRRAALDEIGGWDPHNVTEDADIAVRLMRRGWSSGVIASVTREEAPLDLAVWRAQRVRWVKGWMQTWLVHMRRPWRFHREVGAVQALAFHVVLAGQLASIFVFAPSLLVFLAEVAGLLPLFADRDFVGDLLLVGSLMGMTTGIAGSIVLARRVVGRTAATGRGRPVRLFDLLTMPIYWCLISLAAYRAFGELGFAPHRWNKTAHGRAERDEPTADARATTDGVR